MRARTGYSFRKSVGHIQEVFDYLLLAGNVYENLKVAPISDTNSTFGFVKWDKLCKKAGVKPIFGVEIGVVESVHEKKPIIDHWTFFASGDLKELHHLVALSTSQFRYEPLLTYEQALNTPSLIKISGHRTKLDLIEETPENFYVGLSPSLSKGQLKKAESLGHKFMATNDNRYTAEGDKAFYEVLCGRDASTQSYPQWIMSDEDLRSFLLSNFSMEIVEEAFKNRDKVLAETQWAKLKPAKLFVPEKLKTLEQMCIDGAKKLNCDLTDEVYKARLERELKLIEEKDFEDYFYIIADVVQWARARMAVGPARGSSCGSLVCYLLEITTVDPIPYDLIFERFIDINRDDLPDIDIDFSDVNRQLVFDYMADKYGSGNVARLGTVSMYKPRSALNEAASALDIPPWKVNPVLDSIIERSGGDSRALQAIEDTLNDTEAGRTLLEEYPEIRIAQRMEGHPRHHSQHAAGIVLTEKAVENFVAIDSRTGATHCDKKDAEDLELLKIDALGLTQLSIFEDTLKLAKLDLHTLEKIPLDDQAAFDVLNRGEYSGIFQFNGLALQSVTDQVEIRHLEDIVSITALARPGPLNTGGTNHWIKVKTGREPLTYPHPLFEPYLQNTLGVVAYQEQVMQIGREIGDLSWGDVTALRKAMSKSLGKEYFDQYGDRWKSSALKKGIPQETVDKVWDDLCAYGSWAFNRSHAVAYGIVSYLCCWLMAHYPLEFAAATLTHSKTPENQIKILRELHKEGYDYVAADLELSSEKWQVGSREGKKILVGPLSNVVGIGPKIESQILQARRVGDPVPSRAEKLLSNPVTKIDSLWPISDRIKKLMPDPKERNIFTPNVDLIDCQVNGSEYPVLVFCTVASIKPKDENEEINVAKRGYAFKGPTQALNLRLEDDTDAIFAKVNRFNYKDIGKPIVERGRAGKALYAVKGTVPKDFRMINVQMIRYIGDLEKDEENIVE